METRPDFDLNAAATFASGHPVDAYQWMHANAPVLWHDESNGAGFWAVSSHELVKEVGRDHERFSSEPTITIADADPNDESAGLLGDHKMMLMSDPPYHTRLRRLISRDFTPRSARELTSRVQGLARQIVDEVVEAGECDLVTDLAGEMPSYVIADLLGLPLDDGRELYKLTEILHMAPDAIGADERTRAQTEMFTYAMQVYGERQANPTEDMASTIVHAEVDGRKLDEIDFGLFFMLLIDAGGDTTRNLVSGGMIELFAQPEQLALLRGDLDAYLPNAIDEMLRHVAPVIYMRRTATTDTVLGGQTIAAGDKVVMYYGAANRDGMVFDEPDRFDITRPNASDHVAFGGGGAHFCLGANLARVEIGALLREMLTRLDGLAPTGEATWLASNFISGPTRLPVAFQPGPRLGV